MDVPDPLPTPSTGVRSTTSSERLMLVDDEPNVLRALNRLFRTQGWAIRSCSSAEEALTELTGYQPQVVISDFRMPGMNGVDFLAKVKELVPNAQRIMLTGQADQQAIEDAINRSEIFRFLSKPWNNAQVLLTVTNAFEHHRITTENLRLTEQLQRQNLELRELTAELENRVELRTQLLKRAKRDWEMTFDTLDQPVAVLATRELTLVRANVAYARMAGKPINEVSRSPTCHSFLFGRDTPCPGCPLAPGAAGKRDQVTEVTHNGRTLLLTVYPNADDNRSVCFYRDVTDERALQRRLMESEKMVAIGTLASGVAHELNSPLGSILAFAQLMKQSGPREEEDREAIDVIEESARRCKKIVDTVLQFARRDRPEERSDVSLNDTVERTLTLFRGNLLKRPRLKVAVKVDPQAPTVYANRNQLEQVLVNLLQNAMQAITADEGLIRVETGTQGGRCFFSVSDTGGGIDPQIRSRIFEPYFTTKQSGEGTGLGLAITYGIVDAHGGEIRVDSELGKGTTFTVWLPASSED